jgi:hypothetical protein
MKCATDLALNRRLRAIDVYLTNASLGLAQHGAAKTCSIASLENLRGHLLAALEHTDLAIEVLRQQAHR